MGKVERALTRAADRKAARITVEERNELTRLVVEVGTLERQTIHARARLDAFALDLERKYGLAKGDRIDTDTGSIARRSDAGST